VPCGGRGLEDGGMIRIMNTVLEEKALQQNLEKYTEVYKKRRAFLRYPADWIIRFHNMYMKKNLPSGRVLDYGCGSGNNAKFFIDQGYEVFGTDITESVLPLIQENVGTTENFTIVPPDIDKLTYNDGFFDFILSNQVLYYLGSRERIQTICEEFNRCLKPGGVVFFTMMGSTNYYIVKHANKRTDDIYEIKIEGGHRLTGYHEFIYIVRDEDHLKNLFSIFKCITVGCFDQRMFDMDSNFHWLFAGQKWYYGMSDV
jgi:SAM-dependent methyltransferase